MLIKNLYNTPSWKWPEDAADHIHSILLDTSKQADRLMAAELAGDITVINEDTVKILLTIIQNHDEPETMRSQAAISLGPILEETDISKNDEFNEFDDWGLPETMFQQTQNLLRNLYLDANIPDIVRRRILETSVRAPMDWHQNAIRAAYVSKDNKWQLTAVFCMGYIKGFDDQILESLQSDNDDIRLEAFYAVGNSGLHEAWPHIESILKETDPNKDFLMAAMAAVPSIFPEKAETTVRRFLSFDDAEVVDTAFECLFMATTLIDMDNVVDGDFE